MSREVYSLNNQERQKIEERKYLILIFTIGKLIHRAGILKSTSHPSFMPNFQRAKNSRYQTVDLEAHYWRDALLERSYEQNVESAVKLQMKQKQNTVGVPLSPIHTQFSTTSNTNFIQCLL